MVIYKRRMYITSARNSVGADILSSASVYSDNDRLWLKSSLDCDDGIDVVALLLDLFEFIMPLPFGSSIIIIWKRKLRRLVELWSINFHVKNQVKHIFLKIFDQDWFYIERNCQLGLIGIMKQLYNYLTHTELISKSLSCNKWSIKNYALDNFVSANNLFLLYKFSVLSWMILISNVVMDLYVTSFLNIKSSHNTEILSILMFSNMSSIHLWVFIKIDTQFQTKCKHKTRKSILVSDHHKTIVPLFS